MLSTAPDDLSYHKYQAELTALAHRLQHDPAMVAALREQQLDTSPDHQDSTDRKDSDGQNSPSVSDSVDSDSSDSDSSDSDSSDSDSSDSDSSDSESSDSNRANSDSSDSNSPDRELVADDVHAGHDSDFPCPRHFPRQLDLPARSVHELMPTDVKVVAALGDSLTAARGAGVRSFMAMLFDYRGLSWSIGGDGSYADFTSLPNILREYNPDLYGFSNGRDEDSPGLNVAVTAATSNNLVTQTKRLIRKMQQDPNIDFENDWKVITIFIGGNDVCRACLSPRRLTANNFAHNLQASLDMLQASVPRAFVNVVELMKVEMAPEIARQNGVCENALSMLCNCMAVPRDREAYERNLQLRKDFQKAAEDVVNSGNYDHKKDFTVVLQPFYKDTEPPRKDSHSFATDPSAIFEDVDIDSSSETVQATKPSLPIPHYDVDLSYFAADCFHYSRKGQASAGMNLFNNMLQPVGHKSVRWTGQQRLLCPSAQFPYFATRNNSLHMLKYWKDGEPRETDAVFQPAGHRTGQISMESFQLQEANTKPDMDGEGGEADTASGQSSGTAEKRQDTGTDGHDDMVEEQQYGTVALVVVVMIMISFGLVGLAGLYIHRKRSKSNLYVRIY